MLETITKAEKLITVEEAAAFIQIHEDTVINWIKEGLIEAIKINRTYRITQEELTSYIKRHTMKKSSSFKAGETGRNGYSVLDGHNKERKKESLSASLARAKRNEASYEEARSGSHTQKDLWRKRK